MLLKQFATETWIENIGNKTINKKGKICITKKCFGNAGEDFACKHLFKNGYSIIERNFTSYFGEIDIIALDHNKKSPELVFVEVKSRTNTNCGSPAESVTPFKIKHLIKCAEYYLCVHHLEDYFCRFDVIEVYELFNGDFKINHIKNTFDYNT